MKLSPDYESKQPAFVHYRHWEAGEVPWHVHRRVQLEYVSNGILTIRTEQEIWVTPPQQAVWILPGISHSTYSSHPYDLCSLLLEPTLIELPPKCGVVVVDSLLHDLLLAAAKFGSKYEKDSPEDHLIRVILERLPKLPVSQLYLPEPKDARLRSIVEELSRQLSENRSLSLLAYSAGLTMRTADRLFRSETGMTFGKWRQQLRLSKALEKLAVGESVTDVGLDVGYSNVTSFITMFKKALGITPARYFRQSNEPKSK